MPRRAYEPSVDRRRLDRLTKEFSQTVRAFCDHRPLVRGSFQVFRRRCGKEGCKCLRGELHETVVFIDRDNGQRHIQKVTVGLERALSKPVGGYQGLRKLRARLSKLNAEALGCCDRLCEHRLKAGKRLVARWKRR